MGQGEREQNRGCLQVQHRPPPSNVRARSRSCGHDPSKPGVRMARAGPSPRCSIDSNLCCARGTMMPDESAHGTGSGLPWGWHDGRSGDGRGRRRRERVRGRERGCRRRHPRSRRRRTRRALRPLPVKQGSSVYWFCQFGLPRTPRRPRSRRRGATRPDRGCIVRFDCSHEASEDEPPKAVLLHELREARTLHAEERRRPRDVSLGLCQRARDAVALDLALDVGERRRAARAPARTRRPWRWPRRGQAPSPRVGRPRRRVTAVVEPGRRRRRAIRRTAASGAKVVDVVDEVGRRDDVALGEEGGRAQGVLELAHVAGPAVPAEQVERVGREGLARPRPRSAAMRPRRCSLMRGRSPMRARSGGTSSVMPRRR